MPKKAFLDTFEKCFPKDRIFLARAPPSKLVCIGAEGSFRKFLGSISQNWLSQNSTKGDFFRSTGGRIAEGGGGGGEGRTKSAPVCP